VVEAPAEIAGEAPPEGAEAPTTTTTVGGAEARGRATTQAQPRQTKTTTNRTNGQTSNRWGGRKREEGEQGTAKDWRLSLQTLATMAAAFIAGGFVGTEGGTPALAMYSTPLQAQTAHPIRGGGGMAGQGGPENASSRSYLREPRQEPSSLFHLHGSQKGLQGPQASHQFTVGQFPHYSQTLQDDNLEGRQSSNHQGLLHGQNRSQGLFLATSSEEGSSAVPVFPMAGQELQFSVPAVWPQRQSEVHNQIVQTRRFVPPTERAKMPDLYRRYDSLWKHPGGVQSSSGGSTITIRSTGRGGKRQKICLQTSNCGGLRTAST